MVTMGRRSGNAPIWQGAPLDFERAYRRLVAATELRSPHIAQAVADEFGESLLGAEYVSDEHLDFVCRALLDPVLTKRSGLEELIVGLFVERRKLSGSQLDHIFGYMADGFGLLANEDLAFVIGDFIARVAAPEDALELLLDMTAKATSRQALAGVFLGLDILRKHPAGISLDAIDSADRTADERAAQLETRSNSA
jgi:hypothetical protein